MRCQPCVRWRGAKAVAGCDRTRCAASFAETMRADRRLPAQSRRGPAAANLQAHSLEQPDGIGAVLERPAAGIVDKPLQRRIEACDIAGQKKLKNDQDAQQRGQHAGLPRKRGIAASRGRPGSFSRSALRSCCPCRVLRPSQLARLPLAGLGSRLNCSSPLAIILSTVSTMARRAWAMSRGGASTAGSAVRLRPCA